MKTTSSNKPFWQWFRLEDYQHTIGWFLLTVGIVGTAGDLYYYNLTNVPYLIILGIGLWLIIRDKHIFEESETKKMLRERHMEKVGRGGTVSAPPVFSILQVVLIVLGGVLLSAGLVLLFEFYPTWFYMAMLLANFILFALFFARHNALWLLISGLITLASVYEAINSSGIAQNFNASSVFFLVTIISIAGLVVVSFTKQKFEHYRFVGLALFLYFLAYFSAWLELSNTSITLAAEVALLSFAGCAAFAALFAWMREQRFSYAKYLAMVAAGCVLLYVYLFWSNDAITATWVSCGLLALIAGFTLPSYSARIAGLGTTAVGILYYLAIVVNEPQMILGNIWTSPRIWLGIATLAATFLAWWWYGLIEIHGKEAKMYPAVRAGLMAAGIGVLIAIILVDLSDGWIKIVTTAVIGLLLVYGAKRYRSGATLVCALLLYLYALVQAIVFLPQADTTSRLLLFLSLAILLLPGSIFLTNRS